ncbi:aspartate aminotransferase family protein [Maribacter sp. 2307ULW6-5]|uniref:aspartate aminotransferase family protein n=1 Tax=Maribacter sp. 2307ULW6-5 TaxID=3386275 RepID=UPI0039BC4EDC
MNLFDVYPLYNVTPVSAKGIVVTDDTGKEYLDFYGGHAVISIGHGHPHYVKRLKDQLDAIAFYSNSIKNPLQEELAQKLGSLSGCPQYQLFMCNSGAEANENALKMASFHTGKSKVIAFGNGFHGRTSAAVATTDNPKIVAPLNAQQKVDFVPLNNFAAFEETLAQGGHCAVILEAIQGVGGLDEPTTEFYRFVAQKCNEHKVVLIADEVQSGFGRSGTFFAFQHHGIDPDIISMAKGMGNGFPVGGVLIHNKFEPWYGQLGTTFGGNHLACAATLAVLEVLEKERLLENANELGRYFHGKAAALPQIKKIKGRGLMLGLEFHFEVAALRKELIYEHHIFTGGSANKNLLRFLPALNITEADIDVFFERLATALRSQEQS